MTTEDLIADLRGRINPIYAHVIGTESYERRICADALEAQSEILEKWHPVIAAAVCLVCAPAWDGTSVEGVALEMALRDAGLETK